MKDELKNLAKLLIPYTFFLYIIQFYFQTEVLSMEFYYSLTSIYLFHFVLTFVILISLITIKKFFFEKIGFAFMALSLIKMLASILFLVPLIKMENIDYIPDVLSFFIPYFLFLLFEIMFSVNLLIAIPYD